MALRNPERFCSVSAFSPIVNPTAVPWGQNAFQTYLGEDRQSWQQWDACELLKYYQGKAIPMLVDQGDNDSFLGEQLQPEGLAQVAADIDYPLTLRMQQGYDHSYYFIASFIEQHLEFHMKHLQQA